MRLGCGLLGTCISRNFIIDRIASSTARMSSASSTAGRNVAVVGGGVSGLYCASVLTKYGHSVTVFDLGKHCPGGRLTTRRTSWKGLQFDHGCQFIRPVSEKFKELCQEWHAAGAITPWDGNIVRLEAKSGNVSPRQQQQQQQQLGEQGALPHTAADNGFLDVLGPGQLYVGTPASDSVTNFLASLAGNVRNDVKVSRAAFDSSTGKWLLEGAVRSPARTRTDIKQLPPYTPWNLGVFDALVLADKMVGIPGTPGYVEIEGSTAATKMQQAMAQVGSTPMLALLMAYQPIEVSLSEAVEAAGEGQQQQQQAGPGAITARPVLRLPFDAAAVVNSEEICWICLDSSKPGRARADGIQSVVALSTSAFSEKLIQRNADGSLPPQTPELLAQMVPPMFAAVQKVLQPLLQEEQGKLQEPAFVQVHRWGSAFPGQPFGSQCLTADVAKLAACGDFCLGGGVENAVLSGQAAADAVQNILATEGST